MEDANKEFRHEKEKRKDKTAMMCDVIFVFLFASIAALMLVWLSESNCYSERCSATGHNKQIIQPALPDEDDLGFLFEYVAPSLEPLCRREFIFDTLDINP